MLALTTALFSACSDSDEEPQQPQQTYALNITVQENPLLSPDASRSVNRSSAAATRAAITTTSSLTDFTLNYKYESAASSSIQATADGNQKWTASGSWPSDAAENGYTVNWYAYSDGTFNSGDASISFIVDENAAQQKDLLVATAADTWSHSKGNLSFTFDHACTALRFYVKKATNLKDYTLTVSEVKLCNVKKTGKYNYSNQSWSDVTTNADFTLYSGTPKTLGSTEYEALDATDAPYLFFIPQTLTAWDLTTVPSSETGSYLQLTCTLTKDDDQVFTGKAYIPFATTFEQGYQHDVKINIGKNSLYRSANTKVITE